MRTASKPRPNQVLVQPTKETLYMLFDQMVLTDYSGASSLTHAEVKHIHLNYIVWDLNNTNN
ncbi:MAG: hypothetical protein JWO58_202 [Chitinophagaceae bacterium]|nr:hypothetical protein [Chitinophagaceae bacterium]